MSSDRERLRKASAELISKVAQMMCAPFWWSVGEPSGPSTKILNNGTICYVDTGTRKIGVTANHVYQTYVRAVQKHGADAIECQFGGSTIPPEDRLIEPNDRWDIATFDIPSVLVTASITQRRDHHHAITWPPRRVEAGEPVLYGGHPESLRAEKGAEAELPFHWVMGRVSETDEEHIYLKPEFRSTEWMGTDRNHNPSGWSGGPVFRQIEDQVISRFELVGFIYAFVGEEYVIARHADVVLPDGYLR
jgi:hypothetical protein